MKPSITLVPFTLLLAGCARPAEQKDWGPQIQAANEQLLNQGNLTRAAEFFAPSYVVHVTSGDVSGGPEVIEGFVTGLRTAFPDLRVEVEILATQGDRVAWVRTHRGTHQADFMGVSATNRVVVWRDMVVTRYEAGKIAEEWGVSDLGEQLRTP